MIHCHSQVGLQMGGPPPQPETIERLLIVVYSSVPSRPKIKLRLYKTEAQNARRSLLYEAANGFLNVVRNAHPLKDSARPVGNRSRVALRLT